MRKIIILFFVILIGSYVYSQNYNHEQNLRDSYKELSVISPSPEMKSLIRFDNAEVSTYTGVPDVSIPLFSFECTKDLDFNIGLKYHPDAVKLDERAGSTGLGWSLMAGGSITRVVRGLPDEIVIAENNTPRRGINTSIKISDGNDLDNFISNSTYAPPISNPLSLHDKLFESYESGVYDTQYDLYYYNFMGISGSFYLKVNDNVTKATVVKLDNNTVKIEAKIKTFAPSSPYTFEIESFIIYDEKGNKYLFDVQDKTSRVTEYKTQKIFNSSDPSANLNDNFPVIPIQNTRPVITAYHLSNITPYLHSVPAVVLTYESALESYKDVTSTRRKILSTTPTYSDIAYQSYIQNKMNTPGWQFDDRIRAQFGNKYALNLTLVSTTTNKIKQIAYNNSFFIDFSYGEGRLDSNYANYDKLKKLNKISIYSGLKIGQKILNRINVKQIDLNYAHTASIFYKLILKEMVEYKNTPSDELKRKYKFYYNKENNSFGNLYEDQWGYCTTINPDIDGDRTDLNNIKNFVLEKMELPTGGAIVYEYEPHSYSYIGSSLTTETKGGGIRIKNIGFFDDKNVPQDYFSRNLSQPYLTKLINYKYNLVGVNGELLNLSSGALAFPVPVFKVIREYELFGSYAFTLGRNSKGNIIYETRFVQPNRTDRFKFEIKTNYNNLLSLTTNGSNIGYKNVTITERNNGKKVLTYTSPIDFPEENYTVTYPFLPSKNIDYKRGLLLSEKNYNSNDFLVSQTINTYDYTQNEVTIGLIPFYRNLVNCDRTICNSTPWFRASEFNLKPNVTYATCVIGYFSLPSSPYTYYQNIPKCFSTEGLMDYKLEKRVVGWAKLAKSETTEYLPSAINTVTEYQYNGINKRPKIVRNIIGSDVYSKEISYLNTGEGGLFINTNMYNRISDVSNVVSKFNNEILTTQKVLFKDVNPVNQNTGIIKVGSEMYTPQKIQSSKGTNALEDVLIFTRFDEKGNPIEIKNQNGSYTTLVWGHYKTKLIATIENCKFEEIENNSIYQGIVTNSNSNLTTTASLVTDYNNLINSLGNTKKVNAIVYRVGEGIFAKIDSNGLTQYFNYNELGGLKEIRDNENYLLQQYFEYYKN